MTTTFDPADKSANYTLSNGDLTATYGSSGAYGTAHTTAYKSSGKWYAEFTVTNVGTSTQLGIGNSSLADDSVYVGYDANGVGYRSGGDILHTGDAPEAATAYTTGDVIGIAVDLDTPTFTVYKNGTLAGTMASVAIAGDWCFAISGLGSAQVVTANFGATSFSYAPPSGYTGIDSPPPDEIIVTAPTPTLLTGDNGVVKTAPVTRLITGFNGMVLSAPTPTLVVDIPIYGILATAPTPTLEITGLTGQVITVSATAPVPSLVSAGVPSTTIRAVLTAPSPIASFNGSAGGNITFAGEAPAVQVNFGFVDARLVAPKPSLVLASTIGVVVTVTARAAAPLLSAVVENPASIGIAGSAPVLRLSATLSAGNIITASLRSPSPRGALSAFTGNVATILAEAATPIMAAAGYPAYTITFAGAAPAPRLSATLSATVTAAFRTWVLNTRKSALTEYGSEWAFNSYCVFNGNVLAAGSSGVVVLGTQALDNATAIDSTVKSGKDNFGSSMIKRLPRVYLDYTTGGDAQFKLITTEGGSRTYALNWNNVTGSQTRRIPVGKGPKSSRWQWEYTNVGGVDFDLGAVLAYPQALRRRVQ